MESIGKHVHRYSRHTNTDQECAGGSLIWRFIPTGDTNPLVLINQCVTALRMSEGHPSQSSRLCAGDIYLVVPVRPAFGGDSPRSYHNNLIARCPSCASFLRSVLQSRQLRRLPPRFVPLGSAHVQEGDDLNTPDTRLIS